MELFRAFPLRPIRDDAEYDAATSILDQLAVRNEGTLTSDEQDYLEALTLLVSAYDDEHHRLDTSGLSATDLIKFLMEQQGASVTDLARALGTKTAASFLLNGKRVPSRAQCFKLAEFFHVDPGLFLASPVRRMPKGKHNLP